jgi:hypothetical protein
MSPVASAQAKKIRLFPANLICTDDLDHHEYAHDPNFDVQHVDHELDTSEDEEEGDVDAENANMEESWEPLQDPPIGGNDGAIQDTEIRDKGPHAREATTVAQISVPMFACFPLKSILHNTS